MGSEIQIQDLRFASYISKEEIEAAVTRMAEKINSDYEDKDPLFICILNGSFIFASDLLKSIDFPCNIEFVRLKSYTGTKAIADVKEILGLQVDLKAKDVIIIEDIVDTGHTLANFLETVVQNQPKSVRVASLLVKKDAFVKDFKVDYIGIEIENKFIVGYGLDYNEYGRNLSEIYQLISN